MSFSLKFASPATETKTQSLILNSIGIFLIVASLGVMFGAIFGRATLALTGGLPIMMILAGIGGLWAGICVTLRKSRPE